MKNQNNPKNNHTLAKVISVVVIALIILLFGIYLGTKLQVGYYRMLFGLQSHLFSIIIWSVIIIAILVVFLVLFIMNKLKKK